MPQSAIIEFAKLASVEDVYSVYRFAEAEKVALDPEVVNAGNLLGSTPNPKKTSFRHTFGTEGGHVYTLKGHGGHSQAFREVDAARDAIRNRINPAPAPGLATKLRAAHLPQLKDHKGKAALGVGALGAGAYALHRMMMSKKKDE